MASVKSLESFMKAFKLGNITLVPPRLKPSGGMSGMPGAPGRPSLKNDKLVPSINHKKLRKGKG